MAKAFADEGKPVDEPSTQRILTPSKKPPSPAKEPSQAEIPAAARKQKEAVAEVTASAAQPQVAEDRDNFQALQVQLLQLSREVDRRVRTGAVKYCHW